MTDRWANGPPFSPGTTLREIPPETLGMPLREWLVWDLKWQANSKEHMAAMLAHMAELKKKNPRYIPPMERAIATPRDSYGHKSAGR